MLFEASFGVRVILLLMKVEKFESCVLSRSNVTLWSKGFDINRTAMILGVVTSFTFLRDIFSDMTIIGKSVVISGCVEFKVTVLIYIYMVYMLRRCSVRLRKNEG